MGILQMKGNIWTNVHGATAENTYNEAKDYQEDVHYGLPGGNGEGEDVNALVKVLTYGDDVEWGRWAQVDGEKLIQMLESIGVDLNYVWSDSNEYLIRIDGFAEINFRPDQATVNGGSAYDTVYYPNTTTLKEKILLVCNKAYGDRSAHIALYNMITLNVLSVSGDLISSSYIFNPKNGLVTIIPEN